MTNLALNNLAAENLNEKLELHVEPIASEIRSLKEELERVKLDGHSQRTSLAQKLDPYIQTVESSRHELAQLEKQLSEAKLLVTKLEGLQASINVCFVIVSVRLLLVKLLIFSTPIQDNVHNCSDQDTLSSSRFSH